MKKFLLYLLILVFMVSFVGLIFYLTRPDETILADSETVYLNLGEESTPSYVVENKKKSTKVEISSSDENVAKIDGEKIIANGKGVAVVSITLSNARENKQVIQEKVYVGDGSSSEFPIYIRNEIDLKAIGNKYALGLFFEQTRDITLTEEFKTISGEFSGVYNGNNHKILNYKQTGTKQSTSVFDVVTGAVGFLTFEGVNLDGSFVNASVVAGTNKGLIDYVEVNGKIKNTNESGICGGVVINNTDDGQIQRSTSKINVISSGKVIGGIAAYNSAVITSCQNGDASLKNPINSDFEFVSLDGAVAGGIVAQNECKDETQTQGSVTTTKVKTIVSNCYSVNQIKSKSNDVYWFDGAAWQKLTQSSENEKLFTNSANAHFIIDKSASQNKYFIDNNENGVFDDGDTALTVWDSAAEAENTNIKFTPNCFLGGIIGTDFASGESAEEQESRKTSNIFGNYYLIASDYDLVKRGIGNTSSTIPTSSANLYIANGLTYATVTDPDSIFVSYVISFDIAVDAEKKLKSWPTDIWVLDSSYFPYLINSESATNKLVKLAIDLPVIGAVGKDFTIPSADTFIKYATEGRFTSLDNAGETYYIVKDLDFSGKNFVLVGTDEKPVVVNFDGTGCTLSNLTITSGTSTIKDGTYSTVGDDETQNIGLFGVISNVKISDVHLKNCVFNSTADITSAVNMGGIAGKAITSEIKDCSFTADTNESGSYLGSINASANSKNIGSIVGVSADSTISNCEGEIEMVCINDLASGNKLYIGGVVGGLEGETSINFSTFLGKVTSNINANVYVGGAAGFVSANSTVNTFSGKNVRITSAYAGGIAAVCEGTIENTSVRSVISAKNAGGFVQAAQDSARISNSYCETEFTLSSAEVNAGMASKVSSSTRFVNCVNVNKFNNNSDASKNYSRVGQNVKFEFVCSKITELNAFGSGYAYDDIILSNCFYVNQVDGRDSNDYNKTTFYTQANNSVSGLFGANHVDAKVVLVTWYNGSVRNGRLKTTGGLADGPSTDATWADFGFSDKIWANANQGIRSATLYIA